MNSHLPDLDSQSPADEALSRTAHQFVTLLWGLGVLAPWLLIMMSVASGHYLWLTTINLVANHGAALAVLIGHRRDDRKLVRYGKGGVAITIALCLLALALLPSASADA